MRLFDLSTNNNYDPIFDNCVNFVYDGLNYSNMGKYAGFAKSNPYSSRYVLSKDKNWSTKVFGNKLLQGQVQISDEIIQKADKKL